MGIGIKNVRAERLARQVSAETGDSPMDAIIHSLEERLERLKGRQSAPELVETLMTIRGYRAGPSGDAEHPRAAEAATVDSQ